MRIGKIFCVNLDRRPDRFEEFKGKFPKATIETRVERVSAVDGQKLDSYLLDSFETRIKNNAHNLTVGEMGCMFSHYRIWKNICNEEPDDNLIYLILEDDAHFANPNEFWRILRETFSEKIEFDIVFPGGRFHPSFTGDRMCRFSQVSNHLFRPYDGIPQRTTHFYILSQRGARKLVEHIAQTGRYRAIDLLMENICTQLVRYDLLPHLAYCPADYKSDITRCPQPP